MIFLWMRLKRNGKEKDVLNLIRLRSQYRRPQAEREKTLGILFNGVSCHYGIIA